MTIQSYFRRKLALALHARRRRSIIMLQGAARRYVATRHVEQKRVYVLQQRHWEFAAVKIQVRLVFYIEDRNLIYLMLCSSVAGGVLPLGFNTLFSCRVL